MFTINEETHDLNVSIVYIKSIFDIFGESKKLAKILFFILLLTQ